MKLLPTLSAALLAVTAAEAGARLGESASAQGQAQLEPLEYFDKLMPVLTHDRCANCHGQVDPFTNRDHEGGQIDPGENCTQSHCHTQANNTNQEGEDDWKTAPEAVWFVKPAAAGGFALKSDRELCEQMADRVANRGKQEFMDHLQTDFQIKLGFEGRSGGANTDPQGVPPPLPKTKFLVEAARWMDDGFAVCEREGTIVRTETIESDRTYNPGTIQEMRVKQSGKREVTVRLANGRFETNVEVHGTVTMTQTIRGERNGVPCTTVITTEVAYSEVDDPSPGLFPGQSGSASVNVKLEANGEYTVVVHLGKEKHRSVESSSLQDGCGTVLRPSPPETLETNWSPTTFLFRGKLTDPRDRTRLAGRELHRWFERISPDEDPWLPDHYAAMAQDGTIHPVDIKTSWNIRYRP
jgi:hypothetical protein